MIGREWLHRWYSRRLRKRMDPTTLPRHVALVIDGNRRWAKAAGYDDPNVGHRYGAHHVLQALEWCSDLGIGHVTVYLASQDNLRKRGGDEIDHLMSTVEQVLAQRLARPASRWRLHVAGQLELLPESTAEVLTSAVKTTRDRDGFHVTVAIGYDGHAEITEAVRSLVKEEAAAGTDIVDLAQRLTSDDITAHLPAAHRPPPDLIIRTSGEQRLSGFLLWQSATSQLYFCDVYWPGFRYVDFLRALRGFAVRRRAEQLN